MTTGKEESEARLGTLVDGKWRLIDLIGYTTMAATYRAQHRNGVEMAIRIIHRSFCEFENVVQRFLEEGQLANRIAHPGVQRIFDDGMTDDGCPFQIMELLDGESLELRRVAAGGKLTFEEARPFIDGMLDALIAVHEAGVVHRNLKPGNVFLTRDGRVILTDLGRARLVDDDESIPRMPATNLRRSLAVDNLVTGTPAFMAPEQARGHRGEVDARSDLWSAGAIMFTLLTGKRIHDAPTPQEKLTLAQTQPAPLIRSVAPDVDEDIAMVIDRALAFDKLDRWASAEGMRRAYWVASGRELEGIPKFRPRTKSIPPRLEMFGGEEPPVSPSAVIPPPPPAPSTNPLDVRPQLASEIDPENYQDLLPPPVDAFWAVPKPKKKRRIWTYLLVLLIVGGSAAILRFAFTWGRH